MKKNSFTTLIILGGFLNLAVGICAYIFTRDIIASGIWAFIGLGFLLFDSNTKSSSEKRLNLFTPKKVMSVLCIILAFSMFAYMLYTDFTSLSYNATGSLHEVR